MDSFSTYPLVMTNSLLLKMAIEIVDFPMKNGGSFNSYVSLPEGICHRYSINLDEFGWIAKITASVERINILHLGDHSLNIQLDLSCLINPQLLVNTNIFLLSYGDLGTIWDWSIHSWGHHKWHHISGSIHFGEPQRAPGFIFPRSNVSRCIAKLEDATCRAPRVDLVVH